MASEEDAVAFGGCEGDAGDGLFTAGTGFDFGFGAAGDFGWGGVGLEDFIEAWAGVDPVGS